MGLGPRTNFPDLLTASRPRYTLLDVPGVLNTTADRWLTGVGTLADKSHVRLDIDDLSSKDVPYWWDLTPGVSGSSAVSVLTTKQIAAKPDPVNYDPVTIWVGEPWSAMDRPNQHQAEVEGRLSRLLNAILPAAVERELWTGQVARRAGFSNPYLQQTGVTKVGSGALLGFVTALAELEQGLVDNGVAYGRRIIHAQPRVVTAWASRGLVSPTSDGKALVTALGTYVVPGNGYTGGAPQDESSAASRVASWAYATGPVRVFVGTPTTIEWASPAQYVSSRTANDIELRVETEVLVATASAPRIACFVGLGDEYSGAGS